MFSQQLMNGLCMGAMYSLIAIGYSLTFGVLLFINFAHGNICMVGAYMTWYLLTQLNTGFPVAILGGVVTSVIFGVVIEKIGYLPLRRAPKLALLVISMGFSFIIEIIVQSLWGASPQNMPSVIPLKRYTILNSTFNLTQIVVLVISLVLMALFYIFLQKTKTGIAIRAIALDRYTSGLMGINVNNMVSLMFALGSGIGALSAIMLGTYYSAIYTTMGVDIGMKGFTAVVLGGVGSLPGAMVGGLIIGVLESLGAAYISTGYKDGIAFFVLIIILLVKPSGLFIKEIIKEG